MPDIKAILEEEKNILKRLKEKPTVEHETRQNVPLCGLTVVDRHGDAYCRENEHCK
jgi:hypothetical protein